MNLRASWARAATHLREARSELPEAPVPGTEGGTVESFEEYLDHNELELALDELEGLASTNPTTTHFWFSLRAAASEMDLGSYRERYTRIVEACQPLFDFEVDQGVRGVRIGEEVIPGFPDAERRCPSCDQVLFYHDTFDAYYCAFCNAWLEGACSDSACEYCRARPSHPLKIRANKSCEATGDNVSS